MNCSEKALILPFRRETETLDGKEITGLKLRTTHLTRVAAWQILNRYARMIGLKEGIGTHTLRKTFGYHLYKKGVAIEYIQKMLNHSSPAVTLRYIGITQDQLNDICVDLNL